ncbi:hypothetical protein [Enterococcus hirae]|uniref:hypothetical protein n=1 Tax=Enterococcus hirae TaxID=1354 RepID=UPI00136D121B|nr:hypothetical protein [Enterococcus hirae]NAE18305.1 hypothetical protein [Enterococcus hirae]
MTTTRFNLQKHLEEKGLWTPTGYNRRASGRHCAHCHRVVLAGLDGDPCGWNAITDPYLLNPMQELAALITGRATYRIHISGSGYEIDIRTHWHIDASPAASTDALGPVRVIAEHACTDGHPALLSTEAFTLSGATLGSPGVPCF